MRPRPEFLMYHTTYRYISLSYHRYHKTDISQTERINIASWSHLTKAFGE